MNINEHYDPEVKNLRETCALLIAYLNERKYAFPFRNVLRPYFNHYDLLSGRGVSEIEEKYQELSDKNKLLTAHERLKEIYENSILYGSCATVYFKIDEKIVEDIYQKSISIVCKTSPFSKSFPYPLTELDLKSVTSPNSVLMAIENIDEFYCFQFCYRKYQKVREEINPEEARKLDETYEELYGIKTKYSQAFDRIFMNKNNGDVFFLIDRNTQNELSDYEITYKVNEYTAFFRKLYEQVKEHTELFKAPLNLFPAIEKFYQDTDGNVIQLNHITPTNSRKEEKMRSRVGLVQDLRQEHFHLGGLQRITTTSMFLIEKQWQTPSNFVEASITLPGKSSQTMTESGGQLAYAIFKDYANKEGLFFLFAKLKNAIQNQAVTT